MKMHVSRRHPCRPIIWFTLALSSLFMGCQQRGATSEPAATTAAVSDPVERGRYLVTICSCNDCHTPWKMGAQGPEPDMTRMLSGNPAGMTFTPASYPDGALMAMNPTFTAFAGAPFGTSYSANLTPHDTGLANITEEMFVQAMRTGKHFGTGRPILPPMPWNWIGKMTDEDLHAVFAYLKTIPAIENAVPEPVPPSAPPVH